MYTFLHQKFVAAGFSEFLLKAFVILFWEGIFPETRKTVRRNECTVFFKFLVDLIETIDRAPRFGQ